MTTGQIIKFYSDLLILQYKGKPKAYAHISLIVEPPIMNQLALNVQSGFNITTAIGNQLDLLGKYVGVTRSGNGFTGPITLVDDDFRVLLRFAILSNNVGSSLYEIQYLLNLFFGGKVLVFDYSSMQLSYIMDPSVGSYELAQLIVTEGLLPRPMAVGVSSIIYAPTITKFFGFVSAEVTVMNNVGFNDASNYQTARPWLDAVQVLSY